MLGNRPLLVPGNFTKRTNSRLVPRWEAGLEHFRQVCPPRRIAPWCSAAAPAPKLPSGAKPRASARKLGGGAGSGLSGSDRRRPARRRNRLLPPQIYALLPPATPISSRHYQVRLATFRSPTSSQNHKSQSVLSRAAASAAWIALSPRGRPVAAADPCAWARQNLQRTGRAAAGHCRTVPACPPGFFWWAFACWCGRDQRRSATAGDAQGVSRIPGRE